jgi:uncharacterized Rmd1/YagE family protein
VVGRIEVSDKPDVLWERPDLEREVLLGLLHNRRSLRVEWAIVGLIVCEILLTLYQMWTSAR